MSKPLSEQSYWNSLYTERPVRRAVLDKLADKLPFIRSFGEHVIWNVLLKEYASNGLGLKALEIGSAPGNNLLMLHKLYGYEPFGVEYTEQGYNVNKRNFELHSIDASHVIHADFFTQEFLERYAGQFDLVMSVGFIEHFEDPRSVIEKHIRLLKTGGILLVTIPNLQGVNLRLVRFFDERAVAIHNLHIMNEQSFKMLFSRQCLSTLYCGYVGQINFGLFSTPSRLKNPILLVLKVFQIVLNMLFLLFYSHATPRRENPSWSPYLVYLGKKT
jgi:SAM-dependent methyltransferase